MLKSKFSPQESSGPQSGGSEGKKSNIGLIIIIVVAVIFIIITVNPFGKSDGGGSRGNINPIANFVPENTDVLMTFDILQLDTVKIENLLKAFVGISGEDIPGYDISFDGLTDELDKSLGEIGLSYGADIEPWLEGNIALNLLDFDFDSGDGEFLVLIEAKPSTTGEVDAFIQKLVSSASEYGGFNESEYGGATLYESSSDYMGELAFARHGNYILVSDGSSQIKSAIDQDSSQSLAQSDEYKDLMKKVSGDQFFTFFINEDLLTEFYNTATEYSNYGDMGDFSDLGMPTPTGMVVAFSVEDYGFEFTTAAILDQSGMPDAYKEMQSSMENFQSKTAGMFPEDTIMWAAANHLDLAFDLGFEMLPDMPYGYGLEDFDESIEMMKEYLGIDILEVFDAFDGEFAFGLAPSSDGALNAYQEVGLGLELIVETSKVNVIMDAFDDLMNSYYSSYMNVDEEFVGKMKFFDLSSDYGSVSPLFTFGAGGDFVVFSSSPDLARDSFDGGSSLEDNSLYKKAVSNLPKGSSLSVFINIEALLGIYEDIYGSYGGYSYYDFDMGALGEIFKGIAIGSDVSGNISSSTMMFFIEAP